MKKLINLLGISFLAYCLLSTTFSEESKTWDASDKAKKFVEESIVIGFFASPFGAGWTEDKHFHDYLNRSRDAGINRTLCNPYFYGSLIFLPVYGLKGNDKIIPQ